MTSLVPSQNNLYSAGKQLCARAPSYQQVAVMHRALSSLGSMLTTHDSRALEVKSFLSSHTFLRWPPEQRSWVSHSSSVRTPRLTSCLTDLWAKHQTYQHPFSLFSNRCTDKCTNPLLLSLPLVNRTKINVGPAQRELEGYTVDSADNFIPLQPLWL